MASILPEKYDNILPSLHALIEGLYLTISKLDQASMTLGEC